MGGSSSKTVLSDVAWNMKEAPGKGLLLSLPDSATSIKVICQTQGLVKSEISLNRFS